MPPWQDIVAKDASVATKIVVHLVDAQYCLDADASLSLSLPPDDLQKIEVVIGHGSRLGPQAQHIRNSRECRGRSLFTSRMKSGGCSKGLEEYDQKHEREIMLCGKETDFVVAIGSKVATTYQVALWHQDRRRVYSWNPWGVLRASTFTDWQAKAWDSRNRSRCLGIFQTWQLKLLVSFAGRSNISFLLDLPREFFFRKSTIPSSSTESKRTSTRSRLGASQKTETSLKRRSVRRICATMPFRTEWFELTTLRLFPLVSLIQRSRASPWPWKAPVITRELLF